MNRILLLACTLVVSVAAHAQLYKWVDKDGRVTYSDQPPPAQASKQLSVSPGPAPAAAQRSALDIDKEREKTRQSDREKSKVAEDVAKKAQIDQENCTRAKAYLATMTAGGRIATYDTKGEPTILSDEQIEAERVKAQKAVDEACKPS